MEKAEKLNFAVYFWKFISFWDKPIPTKIVGVHMLKYIKNKIKEVKMYKNNCRLLLQEEEKILRITLGGEIDHHNAVSIRSDIDEQILLRRPSKAVLDLSGIDFMDSSGIGLIMGRYAKMKAIGGELCVLNPNERVLKILKMAGLEKIVSIEYTKNEGEEK